MRGQNSHFERLLIMIMPLSTKQTRFVESYAASNDAKQAALAAGYSAKSIAVEVCRLLKSRPCNTSAARMDVGIFAETRTQNPSRNVIRADDF
ncbi:MAG: hypothetical protein EPN14_02725 [Gallionella sp.]|nr:MAG: hypothetical protein EPN14_02725 [Gallionella sp.]